MHRLSSRTAIIGLLSLAALAVSAARSPADMILTTDAAADGFTLGTFASGFPTVGPNGPMGVAFPGSGRVMVSHYEGAVRVFPSGANGQTATAVPVAQNYGFGNAAGLAQAHANIYLIQQSLGQLVRLNPDGTTGAVVRQVSNLGAVAANPATGNLLVPTTGNVQLLELDPLTGAVTRNYGGLPPFTGTGLAVTANGGTAYLTTANQRLVGLDLTTGAVTFTSGLLPGTGRGVAVGYGSLAGSVYVNTTNGRLVEIDVAANTQRLIGTGGVGGGHLIADPSDGSLFVTQRDHVLRLTPPAGGSFAPPAVPAPPAVVLAAAGAIVLGARTWRRAVVAARA